MRSGGGRDLGERLLEPLFTSHLLHLSLFLSPFFVFRFRRMSPCYFQCASMSLLGVLTGVQTRETSNDQRIEKAV